MNVLWLALAGSLLLASAHAVTPALRRIPERFEASFASFSGGMGLAYVILYLLFELVKDGAVAIHRWAPLGPEPLETLFMLLLASVGASYLLQARLQQSPDRQDDHRGFALFFVSYNLLAGAALVEEAHWGPLNLGLYVLALGLHMVTNDDFLYHTSSADHTWPWRLGLAAAPVAGCGLAALIAPPAGVLYAALTVVAGGTIINVVRREIPDPQRFRPAWFILGSAGYAVLLVANWRF